MSAPKEVWVRVVDGRLQQDFCAITATPETAPSNGVRYVLPSDPTDREVRLARALLGLADQQAMPDDSFNEALAEARVVLKEEQ